MLAPFLPYVIVDDTFVMIGLIHKKNLTNVMN